MRNSDGNGSFWPTRTDRETLVTPDSDEDDEAFQDDSRWESPAAEEETRRRLTPDELFYRPGRISEKEASDEPPQRTMQTVSDQTVQLAVFQEQEMAELLRVLRAASEGNFGVRLQQPAPNMVQQPGAVAEVTTLINHMLDVVEERLESALSAPLPAANAAAPSVRPEETARKEARTAAFARLETHLVYAEQGGTQAVELSLSQSKRLSDGTERAQSVHVAVTEIIAQITDLTAAATSERQEDSSEFDEFVRTMEQMTTRSDVLALNAAIEAARAGESGRSFSIVAAALRRLQGDLEAATHAVRRFHESVKSSDVSAPPLPGDVLPRLQAQQNDLQMLEETMKALAGEETRRRLQWQEVLSHVQTGSAALLVLNESGAMAGRIVLSPAEVSATV